MPPTLGDFLSEEGIRSTLPPKTRETWVAVAGDMLVGMMVLDDGWLDQLYLDPDRR